MEKKVHSIKTRVALLFWKINDYIRRVKYKYINFTNLAHISFFKSCGTKVVLFGRMNITGHSNIIIENNVFIGENATIQGSGGLLIGSNVIISRNVLIYTSNHDWKKGRLPFDYSYVAKKVEIGSNVWIGMNVSIRPGVKIGEGAIIGMNTTILKDIPPLSVVNMHGAVVDTQRNPEDYKRSVDDAYFWNYHEMKKQR